MTQKPPVHPSTSKIIYGTALSELEKQVREVAAGLKELADHYRKVNAEAIRGENEHRADQIQRQAQPDAPSDGTAS